MKPKTLREYYKIDFSDRSCRTDDRKRKKDYYNQTLMDDFFLYIDHIGFDNSTGYHNHLIYNFSEALTADTLKEKIVRELWQEHLQTFVDADFEEQVLDYINDGDSVEDILDMTFEEFEVYKYGEESEN